MQRAMLSPSAPRGLAHDLQSQANGLSRFPLRPRKRLWVPHASASEASATLHTVQTGETLAQIALAYGIAAEQMQEATPKGARGRRAKLRADVVLKPGEELVISTSDTRGAPRAAATPASVPTMGLPAGVPALLAGQPPPQVLAACLGGALLAAGAARLLSAKAPAVSARSAAPSGAGASASAGPAQPLMASAVAEVRALLQDAAVEVNAVESALAAVQRASLAAQVQAAASPAATACAAPSAPAAGGSDGVAAGTSAASVPASKAAAAATRPAGQVPPASNGPLGPASTAQAATTEAPPRVVGATQPEAADRDGSLATPSVAVAAPSQGVSGVGSADGAGPRAAGWADLDAFDTAAQVAAARARVESALEAARGLFKAQAAPTEAAASVAPAAETVVAPLEAAAAVEGAAGGTSASSSSGEPGMPPVVVVGAEAEAGPGSRPMGTAAAGQVLERIRVINKLLEEEQQRSVPSGLRTAAASTVDVSATAAAPSTAAVTSAGTSALAVKVRPEAMAPSPAGDRERAADLLVRVDGLLSSFDRSDGKGQRGRQQQQPQRLDPGASAARASPGSGPGPAAPATGLLPPPPPSSVALPPSPSAADSTTTAKLKLFLPTPVPGSSSPGRQSPTSSPGRGSSGPPSPGAAPAAVPAAAASVSSTLEVAVRPLPSSLPLALPLPGPVMERVRDIGRLLDEGQRRPEQPLAAAPTSTSGAAQTGNAAAAAATPRGSPAAARAAPQVAVQEPSPRPAVLSLPSQAAAQELPLPLASASAAAALATSSGSGSAAAAASAALGIARPDASLVALKSGLLDLVYGTARGVAASPLQRAAIEEFVSALEARNPSAGAEEALSLLSGRWRLVYSSHVGTLLLLGALDGLPLLEAGDVVQTIRRGQGGEMTATNKVDLSAPLALSLRSECELEARSPRRFRVRLSRLGLDTYLATPHVTAALELPPSVRVMGADLDLTPLRRLMEPLSSGVQAAQGALSRSLSSPELHLDSLPLAGPVAEAAGSSWMLTTYLDGGLRICRDEEGRLAVMLKDVSLDADDAAAREA